MPNKFRVKYVIVSGALVVGIVNAEARAIYCHDYCPHTVLPIHAPERHGGFWYDFPAGPNPNVMQVSSTITAALPSGLYLVS